jgi:phytoene/squalene synthetase
MCSDKLNLCRYALGKAIGIANLLRGTHAHSAQRRCYIPADVCARHGVSTEDVYRAKPSEELRNAVGLYTLKPVYKFANPVDP